MADRTKKCKRCERFLVYEMFYPHKDTRDRLCQICKDCEKVRRKKYYQENRRYFINQAIKWQKENAEHRRNYIKQYFAKNKERIDAQRQSYRIKNAIRLREEKKRFRLEHPEKIKEWRKRDYDNRSVERKLSMTLRTRINDIIKGNQRTGSAVRDLGCSVDELKMRFERMFYPHPETGEEMTWENWGPKGWHIDHFIPLSYFDLTNRGEFQEACHWTNLQPIWAEENLSKWGKGPCGCIGGCDKCLKSLRK